MISDPREIRKVLPIGLPSAVVVLAMSYLLTFQVLVPMVFDLQSQSPMIRIYAGAVIGPFIAPLALMMLIVVPMKAVPIFETFTKKTEKPFNVLVLINGIVLMLVLTTSTFLQSHYMPKLGYTHCDLLQGNPTLWSTDWVKNPDWCVKGKTREWVNEQAKLISK